MKSLPASMKSLGICIPTYKRPDFLKKCILSIAHQVNGRPVKIFVADDSADDTNLETLRECQQKFGGIVYHRNPVNLGINENIKKVVELCDSEYVWLIGEDDVFLPGALDKVYGYLSAREHRFIFCNYAAVGDDHVVDGKSALPLAEDLSISNQEFISRFLWAAGFLGACVLQKSKWTEISTNAYAGTYYGHVGHIVELIADNAANPIVVIARPMVGNRATDMRMFTWKDDAFGVFLGFEAMCRIAAERIPKFKSSLDSAIDAYRTKLGYHRIGSLIRYRAEGALDEAQYAKYLKGSTLPNRTRVAARVLLSAPRIASQGIMAIYKLKKSLRRG